MGSYNIRYKNSEDSIQGNVWSKRCQVICDIINWEQPVVWGAQEVLHSQLLDLMSGLDGYDYVGVGRDDGATKGEYAAIFYRSSQVELLNSGHFWLSPTPDKPSLGWDAACIRICTWAHLRDRASQKEFLFLNLHLDHVGHQARREAVAMVMDYVAQRASEQLPAIITGDFNVDQEDEIYTQLVGDGKLNDAYTVSRLRFAENGTWHGFHTDRLTPSRIDHILVSPSIRVDAYALHTDSYWTEGKGSHHVLRHPSDHYPIFARIVLP